MKLFFLLLGGLALSACHNDNAADETAAIKQVLEKESATWRAGDVAGHAQCWQLRPYSRVVVSTGDGTVLDVPPATMLHPPAGAMGHAGTAVQSHYCMSVRGHAAWVSHDEVSTTPAGAKSYSTEFRMLEKVQGQWKLVGQSIHLAKQQ